MLTTLGRVRRRLPLGTRADLTELLDDGRLERSEVEANLRDLAALNRLPGGTRASTTAVERLFDGAHGGRIVDVGAGLGDMPLAFAARGWATVGVDANPDVVAIASDATAMEPRVTIVSADARALPFDDATFDVGHCSLLLHHLDPPSAVTMLRELRRVSRLGVVVNDLRRGLLPLVATAASVAWRSRVTRIDGIASARRSYSLAELDLLLGDAGLRAAWRSSSWLPRVVTAAAPA